MNFTIAKYLSRIIFLLICICFCNGQCTGCNTEFHDCEYEQLTSYEGCNEGDVEVLQQFIDLNSLTNVSMIDLGWQAWDEGQIVYLNISMTDDNIILTQIPANIGSLNQLWYLGLGNNQITSIPESIGELTNLVSLSFSTNNISEIPESIGNINNPNLYQIGFGYNQLTTLPEGIGNLTYLYNLYLSNNELTQLPESIGNMTGLGTINLDSNHIQSLPDSFTNLTQLKHIQAYGNSIQFLPESFGDLISLRSAYFEHNLLQELPESIGELDSVNFHLSFTNNLLVDLPESICDIEGLSGGVSVSLQFNYLCPYENIPVCDEDSQVGLWLSYQNCNWYLPGDTSMDGVVDITDVLLSVSIIIDEANLTHLQVHNSDVNLDDSVDVIDIILAVNIILNE